MLFFLMWNGHREFIFTLDMGLYVLISLPARSEWVNKKVQFIIYLAFSNQCEYSIKHSMGKIWFNITFSFHSTSVHCALFYFLLPASWCSYPVATLLDVSFEIRDNYCTASHILSLSGISNYRMQSRYRVSVPLVFNDISFCPGR